MGLTILLLILGTCTCFSTGSIFMQPFDSTNEKQLVKSLEDILTTSIEADKLLPAQLGLAALGVKHSVNCNRLQKNSPTSKLTNFLQLLKLNGCPIDSVHTQGLDKLLQNSSNARELYEVLSAYSSLSKKVDDSIAKQKLETFLSQSESAISRGYAYHCAVLLNLPKTDLKRFSATLPKVVSSATVSSGQFAFFDGGLLNTAVIVSGILKLEKSTRDKTALSEELRMQLCYYFHMRRLAVAEPLAWSMSIGALKMLLEQSVATPLVLQNAATGTLEVPAISDSQKEISLQISPIWPKLKSTTAVPRLKANRLLRAHDLSPLSTAKLGDLKFDAKKKAHTLSIHSVEEPGAYFVEFTVDRREAKAFLPEKSLVPVQVNVDAASTISSISVKLAKATEPEPLRDLSLKPGETYPDTLSMEFRNKLMIKVKTGSHKLQQVFVQLQSKVGPTPYTITFPCDRTSDGYSKSLSTESILAEGRDIGGLFQVKLTVASFGHKSPLHWKAFEVKLPQMMTADRLPQSEVNRDESLISVAPTAGQKLSYVERRVRVDSKPELKHTFRQPEERASPFFSFVFTLLVPAPFLVLLVGWPLVGVNFGNFPLGLSAPVFHLGLLSIFVVYAAYWLCLNMFVTLKLLALIATPTFLAGNRLLRIMVSRREGKKD